MFFTVCVCVRIRVLCHRCLSLSGKKNNRALRLFPMVPCDTLITEVFYLHSLSIHIYICIPANTEEVEEHYVCESIDESSCGLLEKMHMLPTKKKKTCQLSQRTMKRALKGEGKVRYIFFLSIVPWVALVGKVHACTVVLCAFLPASSSLSPSVEELYASNKKKTVDRVCLNKGTDSTAP